MRQTEQALHGTANNPAEFGIAEEWFVGAVAGHSRMNEEVVKQGRGGRR